MAINSKVNQQTAQAVPPTDIFNNTGGTNFQQQQPQQQAPNKSSIDFFSGSVYAAPMAVNQAGEYLSKMVKVLRAKYDETPSKDNIDVVPLEMMEHGLASSCCCVCVRDTVRKVLSFHPLLLEATSGKFTPVIDSEMNMRIEKILTVEDGYDQVLIGAVVRVLNRQFPTFQLSETDAEVVSRLFDMEDKEQVHRLAMNAGIACTTDLAVNTANFKDVSVPEIIQTGRALRIDLAFNGNGKISPSGLPIRNDLTVTFTGRNGRGDRETSRSIHNTMNQETVISTVSSYVDLLWAPVDGGGYNQFNQQVVVPTQKYAANIIITDIDSAVAYTTGSTLLSIYTALSVREELNWVQYFRPLVTSSMNPREIGILNLEANVLKEPVPSRINTMADNFGLPDLAQLVNALIRPVPLVSLDVSPATSSSWYMSIFAEAANGNRDAYIAIVEAADQLTGNLFSQFFPVGTSMFTNSDQIHLGYYTNTEGVKKDLREIDYLAVANYMLEKNPEFVRAFSDSFTNSGLRTNVRLSLRKKLITEITSNSAVITNTAVRYTFSQAFLNALAASVHATGIMLEVVTPLTGADLRNTRSAAGYVNNSTGTLEPAYSRMSNASAFGGGTSQQRHSSWRN